MLQDFSEAAAGGGYSGGQGGTYDFMNAGGGGGGSYCTGTNSYTIAGNGAMPSPENGTDMTGNSGDGFARITLLEADINYTGSMQKFVVPKTGTYKLETWGAAGGDNSAADTGGKGGYAAGEVYLTRGEILYLYVGGQGGSTTTTLSPGGFNGGGTGGNYSAAYYEGGGGGASDIRIGTDSLYARAIVAGRRPEAQVQTKAQQPYWTWEEQVGGTIGIAGLSGANYAGQGGTQTAGGATGTDRGDQLGLFGQGGNLTKAQTGGGRRPEAGLEEAAVLGKAAAGGSGWVFTESNYNAGYTSSAYTGGTWLLASKYYLTNASTIAGNVTNGMPTHDAAGTMTGNSGNGYIKITLKELAKASPSAAFAPMPALQQSMPLQNEAAALNIWNVTSTSGEVAGAQ